MYLIKEVLPDFSHFSDHFKFGIPLTQTFAYYQWNKYCGNTANFFTIFENKNQIGFFCIFHYKLYKGLKIGYIPYGPVLIKHSVEIMNFIKNFLKEFGKSHALFTIRLDFTIPTYEKIDYLHDIYDKVPIYSISNFIQPRVDWYLDLSKEIDSIYMNMHKNTRYSIRKSYEKGIAVEIIDKNYMNYIDDFESIMIETSKRNHFVSHSKVYYQSVFRILEKLNKKSEYTSWLTITRFDNQILTISLFVGYDNVVHYLYSCSANKHRDKYPIYAAIWDSIKKAKELGYKYLNLGNVDYENGKKFETLTMFKRKFGGNYVFHPNICELKISNLYYYIYLIYKKLFK